jgi:hypothetical protein
MDNVTDATYSISCYILGWCISLKIGTEVHLKLARPGLRSLDVLDAAGIETFESCEGTEGHGPLEPTIRFYGDYSEGFRALAVAVQHELPVAELRRYWQVSRAGEPEGPHWELTFRTPAPICRPRTAGDQPCPNAREPAHAHPYREVPPLDKASADNRGSASIKPG